MPVIDDKGRIFGRLNLIDAFVVVIVLGVIPLVYGAFVLFRVPAPGIASVTPDRIDEGHAVNLRITGTNLRPFLTAYIGNAASPAFLIQSPTTAEVQTPALPAGTYDLVLYDEGQELARKPAAIIVAPPARAVATVHVQFVAPPEAIAQLMPGQTDVPPPQNPGAPPPGLEPAVLTAIGSDRRMIDATVEYWLFSKNGSGPMDRSFHVPERLTVFTATLAVPAVATPTGLMYKDLPVKVGARFTFESRTGLIVGSILSVDAPPASPPTR